MPHEMREDLLSRLRARHAFDKRWETVNFVAYQALLLIAIFSSFGAAIVAAASLASPIVVSLLTAVPGVAIVIDRSFLFADRWRWHNSVSTQFVAFEQKLVFEGATVEEISRVQGEYLLLMETRYPSHAKAGPVATGVE